MTELRARQTARGAAGNILRIENQAKTLTLVEEKVDALLTHFNVDVQSMER